MENPSFQELIRRRVTKGSSGIKTKGVKICSQKIHEKDPLGKTDLHRACENGNTAVVLDLVKKGDNIHARDKYGATPIICACKHRNNIQTLAVLLGEGANVDDTTNNGLSSLDWACKSGNIDAACTLIEHGANIRQRNSNGYSRLQFACSNNFIDLALVLVHMGADIQEPDTTGCSRLQWACDEDHIELAAALIRKGAPIHATCLHWAIRNGHVDIAFILINLDPPLYLDHKDSLGSTPLQLAFENNLVNIALVLIYRGANINDKNHHGDEPLYWACEHGQIEVLLALLDRGASIFGRDICGFTPLHCACLNGHVQLADILLKKGANVHDKSLFGGETTPLHIACLYGHLDTALLLIRNGASIYDKNFYRDGSDNGNALNIYGWYSEKFFCVLANEKRHIEAFFFAETNWRRRKSYLLFISSIKTAIDDKSDVGPFSPCLGMWTRDMQASADLRNRSHRQLKYLQDQVFCGNDIKRLIGSYL